jgi:hypothetical protein
MPARRHAAGAKRRSPERLVRSLENDARIAGARVDSLSNNLDQLRRQAASTNGQDVQLRALEREAKSQRDLLEHTSPNIARPPLATASARSRRRRASFPARSSPTLRISPRSCRSC